MMFGFHPEDPGSSPGWGVTFWRERQIPLTSKWKHQIKGRRLNRSSSHKSHSASPGQEGLAGVGRQVPERVVGERCPQQHFFFFFLQLLDAGSKLEIPVASEVLLVLVDVQPLDLEQAPGVHFGGDGCSLVPLALHHDFVSQLFKDLCHVLAGACTHAEVVQADLLRVVFRLRQLDLAAGLQVALVAGDDDGEVGTQLLSELLHPHRHLLEGVHIRDIVHDECALGSSVVNGVEAVVLFLARRVPN
mmetsp:Transcript_4081/g.6900  ORF Transcript_4081/g.6900 Transcript_4081/m.6900 type:complete len:246 (+) Transcript_4081:236-973(+)